MKTNWEIRAKLWRSVDKRQTADCWHWTAGKTSAGYGAFVVNGVQYLAHRVACAELHGEPTDAKPFALHSCDTPSCCNPHHLRWGSPKDNVADAIKRNRNSKPPVNYPGRQKGKMPRGEQIAHATLNEPKVREIWRMHLAGKNSREIAEALDASRYAVVDLTRGKTWRHLSGAPSIEALKKGGVRRGSNGFNELAKRRLLETRGKG